MLSEPVLSVCPVMLMLVSGCCVKVVPNWFRIGPKFDLISERPTSNETSLGISSFKRLSVVCVTATPVPTVALSIAAFWSCIFLDQILPPTAPAAPPNKAPVAALFRPPTAAPSTAPATAPIPAPCAVPLWVSVMLAQPDNTAMLRATQLNDLNGNDGVVIVFKGVPFQLFAHITMAAIL